MKKILSLLFLLIFACHFGSGYPWFAGSLEDLRKISGSKPIMIMSSFSLAALTLIWAVLSPRVPWGFVFILGFFSVFFHGMLLILATRLFMKTMPESDKITYTSMVHFFSAILALTIGLFGGFLIDVEENLSVPYLHDYSLVFFLLAVATLGINGFCYFF